MGRYESLPPNMAKKDVWATNRKIAQSGHTDGDRTAVKKVSKEGAITLPILVKKENIKAEIGTVNYSNNTYIRRRCH